MKDIIRFRFGFDGKEYSIVEERKPRETKNEHISRVARMMGASIEMSFEKDKKKHDAIFNKYQL
jgi:hypothetical protein